jgi:hypothetical protein
LTTCTACGAELPTGAKFCPTCGTQVGLKKDTFQVTADALVGKVKEIVRDASVKRIIVKNDQGQVLLSIPVTWGAAGAVATVALAPWLAALGVIAALVARVTVEVERSAKS